MPVPQPTNCPYEYEATKWGEYIDPGDLSLTNKEVNRVLVYYMELWKFKGYQDIELYEYFKEDFDRWNSKNFTLANKQCVRDFRDFLAQHGVYFSYVKSPIAKQLEDVLDSKDYREWSTTEVNTQMNRNANFHSKWHPKHTNCIPPQTQSNSSQNYGNKQSLSYSRTSSAPGDDPSSNSKSTLNVISTNIDFKPINFDEARLLSELRKGYRDDDKYGGELYETFDSKLQDFLRMCDSCAIPGYLHNVAFREFLKGRAKDYWRDFLANKDLTFSQLTDAVRSKFETRQKVQEFNVEWRSITLAKVVQESHPKGKSKSECAQILFDKIENLYKGIATASYMALATDADSCLREQVITAFLGDKDCLFALQNSDDTYEGVCSQIRTEIHTAQAVKNAEISGTFLQQQEKEYLNHLDESYAHDNNDQFWIERNYRGRGNYRGNYHGNYRSRGSRGSLQIHSGRRLPSNQASLSSDRCCWICLKPDHRYSQHTKEEQKIHNERWQKQHPGGTKEQYMNEIFNCEGLDIADFDNDENAQPDTAEQNFLDVQIDFDDDFEQYITELGEVNGPEISTMLQNLATVHALTGVDTFNLKSDLDSPDYDSSIPDIFASEGSNRYGPNFPVYRTIVDTG